jgi:ribose 5-phosphate isomerase A
MPPGGQDVAKRAAGRAAVTEYVRSGMKVGLGTGTTAQWFVRGLAEARSEGLDVVGVATSTTTRDVARELGVPLADLNDLEVLDLTVDGADEIDREGSMIKGGGACLLWERIVAVASRRVVAVVDEAKLVDALGAFPLPIEVVPFGWKATRRGLAALLERAGYGAVALELRLLAGEPLVTDSGHYIIDAHLGRITDKALLAERLNRIPGVVENGLFLDVADEVLIGHPDGTTTIQKLPRAR